MPSDMEIVLYLAIYSTIFISICSLLRNKKIAGRALREYIWPVRLCLAGAMVGVSIGYLSIFHSEIGLVVHQLVWAMMSAFSAVILVYYHKFTMKNLVVLGVLFSLWIHGAKCSLRYFVYGVSDPQFRTAEYIASRFVMGSIIVFAAIFITALAIFLINEINKKERNVKKISLLVLSIAVTLVVLFLAAKIYYPEWDIMGNLFSRGPIIIAVIFVAILGTAIEYYVKRTKKAK